ncbi:heme-binding protein [Mycobacterium sp. 21AC1]|uniref:heme-binding protein n=1 Tax=[Mycobacterium] appelbergii TaxID=2939269 RepID=UPI0029394682|nr:heme-binding protein [Mycobacterium sp. 21AC1]MDV3124039.1 heme-binding protein [Mycobacterium sp. 21AC1]
MAFPTSNRSRTVGRLIGASAFLIIASPFLGAALGSAEPPPPPPPPPPNCTAADLAGVASGVATSTSGYLFTHPEVNDFFTGLQGRPHDEVPDAVRTFFDSHPQEHADLRGIRQPLVDFRARCGVADHE